MSKQITTIPKVPEEGAYAIEILVDGLIPNPWNKPRPVDEGLLASVAAQGILTPILVRPTGKTSGPMWEIIAGARRVAAASACGMTSVPAVVRRVDDATARQLTLIENAHRAGLTAWQEAEAVAELLEVCDAPAAAAALGWPVWRVRRRAKLLDLSPEWQDALNDASDPISRFPALWLEEVVVLSHELQDDLIYAARGADDLEDLRRSISNVTSGLANAPFDVTSATLCPKAGACTSCTKRTGAQPDLFPDEVDVKVTSTDSCLDRTCWAEKVKAHKAEKVAVLRAKHGDIPFVAGTSWISGYILESYPGIIASDGYTKAKKSDPGATAALSVVDKYGEELPEPKVVYVVLTSAKAQAAGKKAAGSRADAAADPAKVLEEKRAALETRRWVLVGQYVQEKLAQEAEASGTLQGPAESGESPLRMLALAAAAFGVECIGVTADPWEFLEEQDASNDSDAERALRECVASRMLEKIQLERARARGGEHDNLMREITKTCTFWGIALSELKDAADAEIPEPKSWAKLEAAAPVADAHDAFEDEA